MMTKGMARLTVLMMVCGVVPIGLAQPRSESNLAKVKLLVESSEYSTKQITPSVWKMAFSGKAIGRFDMLVAVSSDIVVLGVVAAKKSQMPMTPALLQTMLRCNDDFDLVKVGLDGDGDAFVRADFDIRVLDRVEFKRIIDQVSGAADKVYTRMQPYLTQ